MKQWIKLLVVACIGFASCRVYQHKHPHKILKQATVTRSTSGDTIAKIKQP